MDTPLSWKKIAKGHWQTECGQYEAKQRGKEWRLYDATGEEHLLCFRLDIAQSKAEQIEFERKHGRYGSRTIIRSEASVLAEKRAKREQTKRRVPGKKIK
jgi:hypothetical protein